MDTYTPGSRSIYAELLNAERAVIAACLMQPARIPEIAAKLSPDAVVGKLHQRILGTLATLSQDGRMPSVQAVLTVLGDEEIEPGLSLKKYLLNLSREAIEGAFLPWQDAVEVVIEWAHRRRIASIGGHLSQGADVAVSLVDCGGSHWHARRCDDRHAPQQAAKL
jgi:replicative DNA helicase